MLTKYTSKVHSHFFRNNSIKYTEPKTYDFIDLRSCRTECIKSNTDVACTTIITFHEIIVLCS